MEIAMEEVKTLDSDAYPDLAGPKSPSDSDSSEKRSESNLNVSDDVAPKKSKKKYLQRLVDSDSDQELDNNETSPNSSSDSDTNIKSAPRRRIQLNNDSDSDASSHAVKNYEQQLRLKNKKLKMRDKFKNLLSSRGKEQPSNEDKQSSNESEREALNESADEEAAGLEEIKKKIKERMSTFKSSICDPDTSDEETQQKPVYKQKKERKSTKMTSPKPQHRMSAKQAMENMQKIKSESNRMLREKEVSLPYHRPKALSLKDIMSRRQPALSSDGKSFPIKMNEKQLQQYAQMLEERQKKMMELWQSESDDDDNDKENDEKANTDTDSMHKEKNIIETSPDFKINNEQLEVNAYNESLKVSHSTEAEMNSLPNIDQPNTPSKTNDECQTDILEEQDSETNITLKYTDSETSMIEDKINKSVDQSAPIITEMTNNDSLENNEELSTVKDTIISNKESHDVNTEDQDTEKIHLHFDTENTATELDSAIDLKQTSAKSIMEIDSMAEPIDDPKILNNEIEAEETNKKKDDGGDGDKAMEIDNFSDDELNMDDIDNIIENAEIMKDIEDKVNSPLLLRDIPMNAKPKLTGAPGMVIDLDGANPLKPKKSGVELLKERFTFFAKLKTPEEMERNKEKKVKPGTQHLKLKQELEEKIAEQRSLEWAKRLEEEKQQQNELKALRGDDSDDDENDIDKIEAKLEECDNEKDDKPEEEEEDAEDEEEEELIENDCEIKDKPRRKNAMLDDEAEVSDCDEEENDGDDQEDNNDPEVNDEPDNDEDNAESENDSDESESSESEEEEEQQAKTKKGRILKAFEDSDDEDVNNKVEIAENVENDKVVKEPAVSAVLGSQPMSQDDELQLAQRQVVSDDLFTSQKSSVVVSQSEDKINETSQSATDMDLGTQTFSILESSKQDDSQTKELNDCNKLTGVDELTDITLPSTFTQNIIPTTTQTETSESQPIGEDLLALCTGKFYDNQFISQSEINNDPEPSQDYDNFVCDTLSNTERTPDIVVPSNDVQSTAIEMSENTTELNTEAGQNKDKTSNIVDDNLKSILDELDDPEFDSPKPNKFFVGGKKDTTVPESQVKKKFVIESDEENDEVSEKKRKKFKKKKLEQRALQFSDDEDDEIEQEDDQNYESEIENDENPDRLVEYDSEENEIEIKPDKPQKKRKVNDFFEDEAELTSEDEWVGSGDENETGLDRMEREEGDEEVFHQGKLQRELGQIHMRDVLDQDKREVRMIQELLFEDGDLGGGGRQRKFRWKNLDGDEETGTLVNDLMESQEDQESEEQWRKQRHEREVFLRQMQAKEENESLNISVNISSKMMSTFEEKKTESPVVADKKTVKDIPSPKKHFILQQRGRDRSYGSSLLSRGGGSLARLAALAAPLAAGAGDADHAPGTMPRVAGRNFVFAALTQDERPKVTIKRKAESNPNTPKLIKKLKTEEKKITSQSSLLDHFKV